jgi:hypothetical protein
MLYTLSCWGCVLLWLECVAVFQGARLIRH